MNNYIKKKSKEPDFEEKGYFKGYHLTTGKPDIGIDYIEMELIDNPFKYGAFGAKGAGELTFVGGAPAFALALEQAIKRHVYNIPATPEYIMELIEHGN